VYEYGYRFGYDPIARRESASPQGASVVRGACRYRGALSRHGLLVALVALLSACAGGPSGSTMGRVDPAPPTSPPRLGLPADCQPYARVELFFGTSRRGGPPVSDQEFSAFMDAEVTPRFPDGLTLISGLGQFRGSDGTLIKDGSKQLILLYRKPSTGNSGTKIEEIRRLYEQKFNQESVLRVDGPDPTCTSF
jgi:hypothetical protein